MNVGIIVFQNNKAWHGKVDEQNVKHDTVTTIALKRCVGKPMLLKNVFSF